MSSYELAYLVLVIATFVVFSVALAWFSRAQGVPAAKRASGTAPERGPIAAH